MIRHRVPNLRFVVFGTVAPAEGGGGRPAAGAAVLENASAAGVGVQGHVARRGLDGPEGADVGRYGEEEEDEVEG